MFKKIVKKENKQRVREEDLDDQIQQNQNPEQDLTSPSIVGYKRMPENDSENLEQTLKAERQKSQTQEHQNANQLRVQITINDNDSGEQQSDEDYENSLPQKQKSFNASSLMNKRRKGVSMREMECEYDKQLKEYENEHPQEEKAEKKTVGLIREGGKQPTFQFTSLGKFEIKDKKLEEYLKNQLPKKGKSDYELDMERKRKEQELAKKRIEDEHKSLYKIPQHLDVDKLNKDRRVIDQTNWVNGLIEVPVSQEKKIMNVEEAEKLRLQQLKKSFNVSSSIDETKPMVSQQDGAKKNDLQRIIAMDRNSLRNNRDKQRDIEQKREFNRKQEEIIQSSLSKKF